MEIKATITRDDYAAFIKYVLKSTKLSSGVDLVAVLCLLSVIFLVNVKYWNDTAYMISEILLVGALFCVALVLFRCVFLFIQKRLPRREQGAVLGERTFRVLDEGFIEVTLETETLVRWQGFHSVAVTGEHIFLMIEAHMGFIVPKRAFESEQSCLEFLMLVRDRIERTRGDDGA